MMFSQADRLYDDCSANHEQFARPLRLIKVRLRSVVRPPDREPASNHIDADVAAVDKASGGHQPIPVVSKSTRGRRWTGVQISELSQMSSTSARLLQYGSPGHRPGPGARGDRASNKVCCHPRRRRRRICMCDQRHATLQRRPKVYRMLSPAMFRTPSASIANGFGKMSIVVAAPFPTWAT